jgi:hypothetical protein
MREGRLQADLARVRHLAATARERVVAHPADQLAGATQGGDE